jgi:hypothetical protein
MTTNETAIGGVPGSGRSARPVSARLSAQALARLLGKARWHGFEPELTTLILGNPKAAVSHRQLVELRAQAAQLLSWREVAEVLAAVDRLVEQLEDWPLPLVQRNVKKMPLELLAAAAELRCGECQPAERPGLEKVRQGLLELIGKRAAKPPEPPKPAEGKRGGRR